MTANEIISRMESLRDEGQRANLMRFFKTGPGEYGEGDQFLGIKVPQTRQVVKAAASLPICEVPQLLASGWHEVRLCGLLILVDRFSRMAARRMEQDPAFHGHADGLIGYPVPYRSFCHDRRNKRRYRTAIVGNDIIGITYIKDSINS